MHLLALLGLWHFFHEQRNASFLPAVHGDIDRIEPWFFKFELLNVDQEIARQKNGIVRHGHVHRNINIGHDAFSVLIHEAQLHFMVSFFRLAEGDAQRNGALRMNGWHLRSEYRVEGSQDVQLPVVIGGGITENRDLYFHICGNTTRRHPARQQVSSDKFPVCSWLEFY